MTGTSTALKRTLTRTLLKFCEDHRYPDAGLKEIRQCLKLLERGDVASAVESYRKVPLGGRMGYFDEWVPPVVLSNETAEYVYTLFTALVAEWSLAMEAPSRIDD